MGSILQTLLIPVKESQKSILRQLIELYEYDFSEYNDNDVNESGFFSYSYLDHYWTEPERFPFFIRIDDKPAGFVLVNDFCNVNSDKSGKAIAEFFVMKKYRKSGIGRVIACRVFDMFPGPWEVSQDENNRISIVFWEKVISEYTGQKYECREVKTKYMTGQALIFDNSRG